MYTQRLINIYTARPESPPFAYASKIANKSSIYSLSVHGSYKGFTAPQFTEKVGRGIRVGDVFTDTALVFRGVSSCHKGLHRRESPVNMQMVII